jgi:hypothetical protein
VVISRGKLELTLSHTQQGKAHSKYISAVFICPNKIEKLTVQTNETCKEESLTSVTLREKKGLKHRLPLGLLVLFLICLVLILSLMSSAVKAQDYTTTAYVNVNPDPVGVGQKVKIDMLVTPSPTNSNVFHNFTVYITKPDGTVVLLGPFTSDSSGYASTQYIPDTVGNYSARLTFPGEFFNNTGDSYSDSGSTMSTFMVQEEPVYLQLVIGVQGSGTTTGLDPGTYSFNPGDTVSVIAVPAPRWFFAYWLLDEVEASGSIAFNMTMFSSYYLDAVFVPTIYSLNISVTGLGNVVPSLGTHQYAADTVVNVTATPNSGWEFYSWSLNGVNAGSSNPYNVLMDSNITLTAVFTQKMFSLTTQVSGQGTTNPAPGVRQYISGTSISVTAIPADGWMLSQWILNGVNVGNASSYTVSINSDSTLTAFFVQQPKSSVRLTIVADGGGNTSPVVGDHYYDLGSVVSVSAQPSLNWTFNHWLLNNVNVSQESTYLVNLDKDCLLIAVFDPVNYRPNSFIDFIGPSSASAGQKVSLTGHGEDSDGVITGYRWTSDIDGLISTSPSFSTTNLSVGTHTIYFEVQDNNGDWSTMAEQVIAIEAATPLSLIMILVAAAAGMISVSVVAFILRGKLGRFFKSDGAKRKDIEPKDDSGEKEREKDNKKRKSSSLKLNSTLPSRIMESKSYNAQLDIKNTGNSDVKDILISAQATPGISIPKRKKKVKILESGKSIEQVFPFNVEKNVDKGYYVLRFDVKSQETNEQIESAYSSVVKIGFLSNSKYSEHQLYRKWLKDHFYAWDELASADVLCNCLLGYNLLIVPPGMELQNQWGSNLVSFVKSGRSLLIMGGNRFLAETEILSKTLGYGKMEFQNGSSNQRSIRILSQHPIATAFGFGEILSLNNCVGDVCVSKNKIGEVVAEYPILNGKSHLPAIIVSEQRGKVVYFNFQLKDPSPSFDVLLRDTIEWLLKTAEGPRKEAKNGKITD